MLEERAKELGRLIGQSEEYKALKRANDALVEDKAAMAALQEMEDLRTKAQQMIERGEQPGEEMERRLDELVGTVQSNGAYQHLAVAQSNFDKTMMRVNEWITDGIRRGAASPIITLG